MGSQRRDRNTTAYHIHGVRGRVGKESESQHVHEPHRPLSVQGSSRHSRCTVLWNRGYMSHTVFLFSIWSQSSHVVVVSASTVSAPGKMHSPI